MAWWIAPLFTSVAVFVTSAALAAAPEVRTQVDADTVGVGDDVHLTIQATVTGSETLFDPQPGTTRGFTVRGQSSMPSTSISIINGMRTDKRGLTATWTLHADRVGTFVVGPPSVAIGGARVTGQSVRIVVVPRGQAPQRPQGGTVSPMDPWKGMFQFDFGNDEPFQLQQPPEVPTDPKLGMDAPRAPIAFLHATVDKTHAVVGEQVTLSILLYVDAMEREPDFNDVHEVTASDFLKRSLLDNDANARPLGATLVGGRVWNVKLVRKSALFPLKTGDLEIGPMVLAIAKARGNTKRESEMLHVRVSEPPVAGRPPGYAVGDVGRFGLSTEVTPREIERGGAVGVTVELSGSGNLPAQLTMPTRPGVEWLTPEVHEKVGALPGTERWGGKRTFSYVVRVQQEGDIDLGAIELPYFEPDTRAYAVARAPLGTIHVKPGATPAVADAPPDALPGLPDPHASLAPPRSARAHLLDGPWYWLGLGASPLAWGFFATARAAARKVRARSKERAADPAREMKSRLAEADHASKNGDAREMDAATARALEASVIACAGVNLRGTTGDAAEAELARAGVQGERAKDVVALYRACEAARFSPDGASVPAAKARWSEAKTLIGALEKTSRSADA